MNKFNSYVVSQSNIEEILLILRKRVNEQFIEGNKPIIDCFMVDSFMVDSLNKDIKEPK